MTAPTNQTAVLPTYRIHIAARTPTSQARLVNAAHQAGISTLSGCVVNRLYFVRGQISQQQVHTIAEQLLADPVTETFTIDDLLYSNDQAVHLTIETTLLPGVTDPPAENLIRAARQLGIDGIEQAATGQQFVLAGELTAVQLQQLTTSILANPVIQRFRLNAPITPPFVDSHPVNLTVEQIDLRAVNDATLLSISQERRLALDLNEMRAVQAYYQQEDRPATDVELEMIAQTWSEHCVHKTFKAQIAYTGPDGKQEQIDGLLKQYIRRATDEINKPWVYSAFVDNAGIVRFNDQYDLAFKAETHNHPSALEPFGGANTGVGGVIRDILGVSAKPIANTDVLCFGLPETPAEMVPEGVLHPRRIASGVIAGIEDYGNKMGIPTVNGSIHYHPGYTANPLVYCGCVGILPHGSHRTDPQAGDAVVAIGGRTGRDGLRGATFSSMEMDVATSEIAGTAVQIGHPIMEKQVQEVVLQARDAGLYTAITDCGAGGYSSAVGEMGEKLGAIIQLESVKLKYPGLQPWEIWLSEAQERMVLAVPPENLPALQAICDGQDVELLNLGTFGNNGRLHIYHGDRLVGDLAMPFLHDGIPQRQLIAQWQPSSQPPPGTNKPPMPPHQLLLALLAHPDIRSKEDVVRLYDHEVQGGTAVKPFVGVMNHGPSDATVIVPTLSSSSAKGFALSNGIRPGYTAYDPYHMAWAAVDEALRNVVAVGADPDQVSILDNFCWGNPNLPDRLGALVRCAQGCYDAAIAYQTPFISGKDSLNNEYTGADGEKHAIPGTLLISAMGMVPDVSQTTTMDLKQAGNQLLIIGETKEERLGSHAALINSQPSPSTTQLPIPGENPLATLRVLHQAIKAGLVQSCHDLSEGGLAVALAEMCLAGGLGATVDTTAVPTPEPLSETAVLFSESLTRFVIEVRPEALEAVAALLDGVPHAAIGTVTGENLVVNGRSAQPLIDLPISQLNEAWRGHLQAIEAGGTVANEASQPVSRSANYPAPTVQSAPKVLIMHANGTNRDHDAALACKLAGGEPEIVHINQLMGGERRLDAYGMMVVPGGFSYGDDLGAGVLWSLDLQTRFGEAMARFVENGRLLLGICNGFQTLVKAGLLPGINLTAETGRDVTLTYNETGQFECRWVTLAPNPASPSLFTQGLTEPITCPVAHGEGRLMVRNTAVLDALEAQQLIPLRYASPTDLSPVAELPYPINPNGSVANIAALCNPAGNVMGLMPHPENHIFPWQHPRAHRGERGMHGLRLFINGINHI